METTHDYLVISLTINQLNRYHKGEAFVYNLSTISRHVSTYP